MWAFSDESERANARLMAVVLVSPRDAQPARMSMRALLLAGQRQVHTNGESSRRRRVVLDTVAGLSVQAVVLRHRPVVGLRPTACRHRLLQAATGLVVGSGVTAWTLDDQEASQRERDRASIAHSLGGVEPSLHPSYDHRPASSEPLLWIADAICWAAGAGGEWRRRIGAVLTVRDIGP